MRERSGGRPLGGRYTAWPRVRPGWSAGGVPAGGRPWWPTGGVPAGVRLWWPAGSGRWRAGVVMLGVLCALPVLGGHPAVRTVPAGLAVLAAVAGLAATVPAVRIGRAAGRAELLRILHDTVLQTLEAMAVQPAGPAGGMRTAAELRAAAGAEADRLRRALGDLAGRRARPLADTLAEVAGEFGRLGLRTEVLAAGDLPELSPRRAAAVRDATRAALGNVVKHAGVGRAVLRADSVDGGLRLVVRDHGVGFDPSRTLPGFGLGQSVVARLREVGGRAGVTSSPGAGPRVLLWVPR